MTIGDRIRIKRINLKMTQEELASKLGYKTKSSINKIELGIQELPQRKIAAFAKALDTTPAYLMGWEEGEDAIEKFRQLSGDREVILSSVEIDIIDAYRDADDLTKAMVLRTLGLDKDIVTESRTG